MSVYIREFPPALRKIFDDKARPVFITLIYKIDTAKELDYALNRESHLKALDDLIARRFAVSTAENEPARLEARTKLEEGLAAYKRENSRRFADKKAARTSITPPDLQDKWFGEIIAWLDKCFDDFEARLEELHAIVVKYIFVATLILLSKDFRLEGLTASERKAKVAESARRFFSFSA